MGRRPRTACRFLTDAGLRGSPVKALAEELDEARRELADLKAVCARLRSSLDAYQRQAAAAERQRAHFEEQYRRAIASSLPKRKPVSTLPPRCCKFAECVSRFSPKRHDQLFCSHDCRRLDRLQAERAVMKVLKPPPRRCEREGCTVVFQPSRESQRFCSRECRFKARSVSWHRQRLGAPSN